MSDRRQLSGALQTVEEFPVAAPQFRQDGAAPRRDGVAGFPEISSFGHGRTTDRRGKYFPSGRRRGGRPGRRGSGECGVPAPRFRPADSALETGGGLMGVARHASDMAIDNAPVVEPTPASRGYLASAVDFLLPATVAAIAAFTFAMVVML